MKNELLKMLLTRFSDETLYAENGLALRYRLFTGKGENLPLVLFLHGMGERGHDNQAQILNNGGAHLWAAEEIQQKYPCHIVAPQCPDTLSSGRSRHARTFGAAGGYPLCPIEG